MLVKVKYIDANIEENISVYDDYMDRLKECVNNVYIPKINRIPAVREISEKLVRDMIKDGVVRMYYVNYPEYKQQVNNVINKIIRGKYV